MKTLARLIAEVSVAFVLYPGTLAQSQPDFVIAVSDPEVTAPLGGGDNPGFGGATYNGTLTSLNGYNRPVTLSCVNLNIAGCYFDGSPGSSTYVPSPGGTPFTILAATDTVHMGDENFFVQGIGAGSMQHQLPLTLHVFSFGAPDFVNPTITVVAGSISTPVSITYKKSGTSARPPAIFFCGGLPAGATCSTHPATIFLDTGTTAPYSVTVATSTPPGTYTSPFFAARAVPANATPFTRSGGLFTLVVQPASGLNADVSVASVQSADVQPVAVGQLVTFTAQVNNSGPDTARSAVSFVFSPSASIYSVSGGQGCVIATNITCDLGQLASGTGATLSVTVQAPFSRTLSATAFATSNAVDPNPGNNVLDSDAVAIRLRPLARKGLPVGQP